MQQQLLEHIYLHYQPQHYYQTYLKQNKIRPDGRKTEEHRPLRLSISPTIINYQSGSKLPTCIINSSVTVSRESTVIMATLSLNLEQVIYSPVSQSYGKRLIHVNTSSITNLTGKQARLDRNRSRVLDDYINGFIQWEMLEKQLVWSCGDSGCLAYAGILTIRVLSSDGCIEETALLAAQTLLWTTKFAKIEDLCNNKVPSSYNLNNLAFNLPIKYVEIESQLLIDPTRQEEESSDYQLTMISNLKAPKIETNRILRVHRNGSLNQQLSNSIKSLYQVELSKLAFNIEAIRQKCRISSEYVVVNII